MLASRGMGDINPEKIPKVRKMKRREDFDYYSKKTKKKMKPRKENL